MKLPYPLGIAISLLAGSSVRGLCAQAPRNVGVTFDGETDALEPLSADQWHTITASYRYDGAIDLLTNTYLVFARGSDQLSGFYVGYHLPTNQLAIVKHGYWNATEATGAPGEVGRILENDQGQVDCEHTIVHRTADEVSVAYRVRFKPGVLKGSYNVFQYIEDRDVRYEGFTLMASVSIGEEGTVRHTDMPPEWQNALRPAGRPAAALTLADGGAATYGLLIPRNAQPIERKAAADLRLHLKLITGADFPVLTEGTLEAGPCVSLGRTERLAQSSCRWKSADLAAEGYAIEVAGGDVFLYGGTGRGLLHGVYSLLEEDLGCRWYSPTSVDAPSLPTLTIGLVPRKYVPVLELRDPYIHRLHDPTWSLRNKTNTPHARIPSAWGGSLRYYHMGHTYAAYFPTDQYFADHPEYYALVNGRRQPSQLCHTNEDVIRLSIEKACEIFRNHPEVRITAIGPNDGRGFCDCADCRRLDDENGGRSGSFFHFVNRIAEGVRREFPDNRLICLAYLDYARPPTNLRVADNVIVQLCTDSHAWKYQFCFVWESAEFQAILKAWQAARARVFIWDYTTDYVHYLVPMANWPVVAENTRFHVRHGVAGVMYESEVNDIDEMRGWVWAKQLWNPALDTRSLMRDFVFGYYKEAGQPLWDYQEMLWAYWKKWHAVPHQPGVPSAHPLLNNLQCSYAPDGPMFTPEFMAEMRRCFAEAERLAQSDEILTRVKRAKLSLLYLELCQNLGYYTEFGDFVPGKAAAQPAAARQAFRAPLDEFVDVCTRNGLTTLGIPVSLDRIAARWRSCLDAEGAPAKVYLPAEWAFATDPQDRGVRENWPADARYYGAALKLSVATDGAQPMAPELGKGLARLHVNRGVGWEQQGFPGFEGYGWYFQHLEVPAGLADRRHLHLCFLGVNEQAWVYLNGELAFERSYASTGKGVGELTGTPFSFDASRWLRGAGPHRIAVRVTHATGLGGICQPAMLVGTDEECTTEQLGAYRF